MYSKRRRQYDRKPVQISPTVDYETTFNSEQESSLEEESSRVSIYDWERGNSTTTQKVDVVLSRMVQDRIYGYRRDNDGAQYELSPVEEASVQFKNGNLLKFNADRLNYMAKRQLAHNRLEEAQEIYEIAIDIDPRDGRAYLGLANIAKRRRDFTFARDCLNAGIRNSASSYVSNGNTIYDWGANPFLLQALGCLEEEMGYLAEAEKLYIEATKSRPCHAAAWVSLGQLRIKKLRQGAQSARVCFINAERELQRAGLPMSSHVYTAWASLEYKYANDFRLARNLFTKALRVDRRCSAAWLQLGSMEASNENYEMAQKCFDTVLKFDKRNSRVLQAYAIMESKRPDGDDRKVIDLFERALAVKPRDGAVLQAYGLFVLNLGDVDGARQLLRRGTKVNRRHAPLWQAWGVLEMRYGTLEAARDIFQKGIWACAQAGGVQSGGNACARLWQAWGILEAKDGNYAESRRCFGRALDADRRNVAVITAWAQMERLIGNVQDARAVYERALQEFPANTPDRNILWTAYEAMEKNSGNTAASLSIYQRSMRETMVQPEHPPDEIETEFVDMVPPPPPPDNNKEEKEQKEKKGKKQKYQVMQWQAASSPRGTKIWYHNGAIEGKVPPSFMKSVKTQKPIQGQQPEL